MFGILALFRNRDNIISSGLIMLSKHASMFSVHRRQIMHNKVVGGLCEQITITACNSCNI